MSHWTHFVTEADINTAPEQWEENECIPVPEGFDEAWLASLEREAQRAEHKGLMVCGDDEWGCR